MQNLKWRNQNIDKYMGNHNIYTMNSELSNPEPNSRRNEEKILIKNTAVLSISRTITSLIPAVIVIIVGRNLGNEGLGLIFGVLALVLLFYPFTDFGYSQILIREISRNRDKARVVISKALGFTLVSSIFFLILVLGVSTFIKNLPFLYVLIMAVSYISLHSLLRVWGSSFQAIDKLELLAAMEMLDIVIRFIGILILILIHKLSVLNVIYLYLLSSIILIIIVFSVGFKIFGFIPLKPQLISKKEIIESLHFSLNALGTSIFFQLDKVMLSKFSTISSVGIYTFAQKVFSFFINILGALLMTAYPWFFRFGGGGDKRKFYSFSKRISTIVFIFGTFSGLIVYFTAPWIVKLMGPSFRESILALRILSSYPLLRGISSVLGDMLTGADYQKERMQIIWIGAIVNIFLNLILILLYGWIGAAIATLSSYFLVTILELAIIKRKGIFRER